MPLPTPRHSPPGAQASASSRMASQWQLCDVQVYVGFQKKHTYHIYIYILAGASDYNFSSSNFRSFNLFRTLGHIPSHICLTGEPIRKSHDHILFSNACGDVSQHWSWQGKPDLQDPARSVVGGPNLNLKWGFLSEILWNPGLSRNVGLRISCRATFGATSS